MICDSAPPIIPQRAACAFKTDVLLAPLGASVRTSNKGYYNLLVTHEDVLRRQQQLADQLAQRASLAAQLAEVHTAIEQLATQIGEYDAVVTQSEAEAGQARSEAEKLERRRDTVARLGPDGVCDACGQIL